jgi:hypothetical protein
MTKKSEPGHLVVDGSNIATEGRSMPSLAQLNDAVLAYMDEHPGITVTVVVDATFGHRIDKSEVKEFDSAVANNELVAPPAGAVGRGDAFVLGIADKAKATILSNDSFQEFHGEYEWLFDEGRLVGGKPVPHVGWVFVPRVPVRGPISRKATRDGRNGEPAPRRSRGDSTGRRSRAVSTDFDTVVRTGSKEANQPMPVPSAPPPGRSPRAGAPRAAGSRAPKVADTVEAAVSEAQLAPVSSSAIVNELMPFLEFVEHHPVGTSVNATVESYSSHGAYVSIGPVRGYVPLRLMSDPAPRSAREVMKLGDAVTLVVADFAPARRSIDCALPHMASEVTPEDSTVIIEAAVAAEPVSRQARARRSPRQRVGAGEAAAPETSSASASSPAASARTSGPAQAKKAAARKTAPTPSSRAGSAVKALAKQAAVKAPARKAAAKKAAAKKASAKKAAAVRPPAKKVAAVKPPAKKAAAKKAPAKKVAAVKPPAKAASSDRLPARKVASKKTAATKAPATKAPATRAPATKAPATRAPATRAPATKAPATKAPAAKKAARKSPTGHEASGTS